MCHIVLMDTENSRPVADFNQVLYIRLPLAIAI